LKGLSVPVRADATGQLVFDDGEDQLKKIIMLNLADGTSDNPFQDLGVGTGSIFAVTDSRRVTYIRERINRLFARLKAEGRAQLASTPEFSVLAGSGELVVDVRYLNLETEMDGELKLAFGGTQPGVAI